MIDLDNLTYIGRFGKKHGYKGEINLGFAQFPDDLYLREGEPMIVEIDGTFIPFYVKHFRTRGKDYTWLVTIAKYNGEAMDTNEVEQLEGRDVYGLIDRVMELYPDFTPETDFDLEGYYMTDKKYGPVGTILEFDASTENMLIEVELEDGRRVTLPMNFDFIISETAEEDGSNPSIVTEYPEGLLDSLLDPGYDSDIPDIDE